MGPMAEEEAGSAEPEPERGVEEQAKAPRPSRRLSRLVVAAAGLLLGIAYQPALRIACPETAVNLGIIRSGLADYQSSADPWGQTMRWPPGDGALYSCGPNGMDEGGKGDDIPVTWAHPFNPAHQLLAWLGYGMVLLSLTILWYEAWRPLAPSRVFSPAGVAFLLLRSCSAAVGWAACGLAFLDKFKSDDGFTPSRESNPLADSLSGWTWVPLEIAFVGTILLLFFGLTLGLDLRTQPQRKGEGARDCP